MVLHVPGGLESGEDDVGHVPLLPDGAETDKGLFVILSDEGIEATRCNVRGTVPPGKALEYNNSNSSKNRKRRERLTRKLWQARRKHDQRPRKKRRDERPKRKRQDESGQTKG